MAHEGVNLRMACHIDANLANHTAEDVLPEIQPFFKWKKKTKRFGEFEDINFANVERECHIIQPFDPESGSLQNGLKVACTENLIVIKAIRNMDDGFYGCVASLNINGQDMAYYEDDVLLKIETGTNVSTVVITCVLVSVVLIFLIIGACFKMAGHKLTWEKTDHNVDRFMHEHQFGEDHFHGRTRTHSLTSNVSGIVFSVSIIAH